MVEHYRLNAGIVVFNKARKVLLCRRNDVKDSWQFPQGGIDKGETPKEAAVRELREETSVVSVKFIEALPQPLKYDFPDNIKQRHPERHYDGQEQYWHLFLFEGNDDEINLKTEEPEFRSYEWVDIMTAPKKVVDFKKKIYDVVAKEFALSIKKYLHK